MSWRDEVEFKDLVGAQVIDARFNKGCIYLNCKDGVCYELAPEGDCCAQCYILHIDGADALVKATIKSVEDLAVSLTPEEEEEYSGEYSDVIEAWGHRILTDKGICTIEMRVSHNGYYGGRLVVEKLNYYNNEKLLEDF